MPSGYPFCRRTFLQSTLTTAACGFVHSTRAVGPTDDSLIDTHVYLGRWPFARLLGDESSALAATLRSHNASRAWAGSFDALFHKDVAGANLRLVDACREEGDGLLVPFGAVNPTLPEWEEELRRCHETYRMPGIRLHPNYHGYSLDDPRFAQLLELATGQQLIVQVVAQLSDERHAFLNPHSPQVDLATLVGIKHPTNLRMLVTLGRDATDLGLLRALARDRDIYFDFSRTARADRRLKMMEQLPADRTVFGSELPLDGAVATIKMFEEAGAGLGPAQLRSWRNGAAKRLSDGFL